MPNTLLTLGDPPIARNAPYQGQATIRNNPPGYATQLPPLDEMAFQQWVARNGVPFDPRPTSDYDMRGFYRAQQQGDPRARTELNSNDQRMHFTDAFKTPYHESFSGGSQYAGPVAPRWNPLDQLISPGGRILFDERNR